MFVDYSRSASASGDDDELPAVRTELPWCGNRLLRSGHKLNGGLDIFKAPVTNQGFGELQNPGYPLNTNGDEFSIVIDSTLFALNSGG